MLKIIIDIAIKAGEIVLKNRDKLFEYTKTDGSPVTNADLESSNFIENELRKYFSFPIVSEESSLIPNKIFDKFFLVDPLDGTKDFLALYNDFSVNIALIEYGVPSLGVIFAPALNELFYAEARKGSFVVRNNKTLILPLIRPSEIIIAKSRFHETPKTDSFIEKNKIKKEVVIGSSLKLCRIAEGAVNLYVRYAPTKEWDTAAGHIIIKETGGNIFSLKDFKEVMYNKPAFVNEGFVAFSPDINLGSLHF